MDIRVSNLPMKKGRIVELPDEIWVKIIEIGIENSILTHKDVCSLSLSSKHFNELSNEETVWSTFLSLKFPQPDQISSSSLSQSVQSSCCCKKTLYRCRVKLEIDSNRRTVYLIRRKLIAMTRKLNRHRRDIVVEKEVLQADKELSAAEEARYNHLFGRLDSMEKYMNDMKKDVYCKHAYYKKRFGVFRESTSDVPGDIDQLRSI